MRAAGGVVVGHSLRAGVFLVAAISGFCLLSAEAEDNVSTPTPSPPSPPPPNRDWTYAGGVYSSPVQWNNDTVITVGGCWIPLFTRVMYLFALLTLAPSSPDVASMTAMRKPPSAPRPRRASHGRTRGSRCALWRPHARWPCWGKTTILQSKHTQFGDSQ
jgi:hypothetical protein